MTKKKTSSLRAGLFKLELDHPIDGKACGWILDLRGFDSSAMRDAIKQVAIDTQDRDETKLSSLELLNLKEADNAKLAATSIVGWNAEFAGLDEIGSYSKEKALEIVSDPELTWIKSQIESALGRRSNFFR